MIPDEIVEQVSQQADIVAIISEHVKLKKMGSVWRGPCPFHQGTNNNFSVIPGKGYTCFVCGEKGSVFTFVQKRLGMTFVDAVKFVGEKCGVEVKEIDRKREGADPREPMWELHATVAEWFQRTLWESPAAEVARSYLSGRGVGRATAERFGIGYAPHELGAMRQHLHGLGYDDATLLAAGLLVQREEGMEPRPRFRDRLIFPILDPSGHTVGFGGRLLGPGEPKYLNSAESEIFTKGRVLYNLSNARNAIRKDDRVVLVEGYFDVLRLVDAGVESVVAPMGTALAEGQADLLARYTRNVFILYDADAAGQKATFRAADILLEKGLIVRTVTLPEGEDPDSFAQKEGGAAVEKLLDEAMDVFDRKVQLLERAGWFSDLQRKRKAIDRLLPTIRAASDPLTRDLYLARAAAAAGIDREALAREVQTVRRGGGRAVSAPAGASRSSAGPVGGRGAERNDAAGRTPRVMDDQPYRSTVEQGSAEQSLLRVMLTQRFYFDTVIEELSKLESEEHPDGVDVGEGASEDDGSALRDPVYRAIYEAVRALGPDASAEAVADVLEPQMIRVYEDLRGEPEAVVDARKTVDDAVRALRARAIDTRLRGLERLLSLASPAEQDALNVAIKRLADERRAMGVARWKAVGRRTT